MIFFDIGILVVITSVQYTACHSKVKMSVLVNIKISVKLLGIYP